jgi:hypothetical protein
MTLGGYFNRPLVAIEVAKPRWEDLRYPDTWRNAWRTADEGEGYLKIEGWPEGKWRYRKTLFRKNHYHYPVGHGIKACEWTDDTDVYTIDVWDTEDSDNDEPLIHTTCDNAEGDVASSEDTFSDSRETNDKGWTMTEETHQHTFLFWSWTTTNTVVRDESGNVIYSGDRTTAERVLISGPLPHKPGHIKDREPDDEPKSVTVERTGSALIESAEEVADQAQTHNGEGGYGTNSYTGGSGQESNGQHPVRVWTDQLGNIRVQNADGTFTDFGRFRGMGGGYEYTEGAEYTGSTRFRGYDDAHSEHLSEYLNSYTSSAE